jgi:hypothetical protein
MESGYTHEDLERMIREVSDKLDALQNDHRPAELVAVMRDVVKLQAAILRHVMRESPKT